MAAPARHWTALRDAAKFLVADTLLVAHRLPWSTDPAARWSTSSVWQSAIRRVSPKASSKTSRESSSVWPASWPRPSSAAAHARTTWAGPGTGAGQAPSFVMPLPRCTNRLGSGIGRRNPSYQRIQPSTTSRTADVISSHGSAPKPARRFALAARRVRLRPSHADLAWNIRRWSLRSLWRLFHARKSTTGLAVSSFLGTARAAKTGKTNFTTPIRTNWRSGSIP